MHPRDASLRGLADIGEGVMLTPVRVCFGALFRRHSRSPSRLCGADRGGLRCAYTRGRRCGAGGVRAVAPQEGRLSRHSGGALVALRGRTQAGQQPPSRDAPGRGARAGMGSGRGGGHGRSGRCSQDAWPSRASGVEAGPGGDVGILDGAARGQGSGRGCGRTGTQRQHDALTRAARAFAPSTGVDGGARVAGGGVGIDGDHVRGGVGRGGGGA